MSEEYGIYGQRVPNFEVDGILYSASLQDSYRLSIDPCDTHNGFFSFKEDTEHATAGSWRTADTPGDKLTLRKRFRVEEWDPDLRF